MKFCEWLGKVLIFSAALVVTANQHDNVCMVRHGLANCSASRLRFIPLDLAPTVVSLDMSRNQLYSVEWPLPYIHLVHLNLSRNSIQKVTYHAFIHLYSLDTLDLSFNNIRYLSMLDSNYTFFYTPQIVNLILKGNPLKALGSDPIKSDSLRKLDLSECDVRKLEGMSSLLEMTSLISLSLNKNPLVMIDILKSITLEELYLQETQLRFIKQELYAGLPMLKLLDVSNNPYLTSLSRVGRANSSSLIILKADFCSLEYLEIVGFPRLEMLYLRGNRISRIDRGDFAYNYELTEIDLSMNWIHRIDPMGFYGVNNLVMLDLSANKINDLGNCLTTFSKLIFLNISYNPLVNMEGVEAAQHLTILDASHCELMTLPAGFLAEGQLVVVNLSKNALGSLPSHMSSFTLIELDLSFNRLTHIDDSWFKHFPILRKLRLEGNRLTEPFHPDMLDRLGHVNIYLDDNPWRCNCGETRYRNFYSHLFKKGISHDLTCQGPENVTGLTWQSACFPIETEANIKRVKKNAWIPMLISALVTLGIIFLLFHLKRRSGISQVENRSADAETVVQNTARAPFREESSLPTYEEALLMPKPKETSKSNADTQTQVSYLGSARSLDSRTKHSLARSPSSNSL